VTKKTIKLKATPGKFYFGVKRHEKSKSVVGLAYSSQPENITFIDSKDVKTSREAELGKDGKGPFHLAISSYLREMETLIEGTSLIDLIIPAISDFAHESNVQRYLAKHAKRQAQTEFELYEIPQEKYSGFTEALNSASRWRSYVQALPNMTFTNIVSTYDGFLHRLLSAVYEIRPEILNVSERKLQVSEILLHENYDSLKKQIIQKEVETLLRDSHEDQISWLEGKLGIPLRDDKKLWSEFIEVCERRNLFVHANGIVSQQYLDKCKKAGCSDVGTKNVGESLPISRDYLKRAANVFFEFGLKLGHVVWRKLSKSKDDTDAEASYSDTCFELLSSKRYQLANRMFEFGVSMKNVADNHLRIMTVNYANSLKLSGDKAGSERILKSLDWSASAIEFRISIAAIRQDVDRLVDLMEVSGVRGRPNKSEYVSWPAFLHVRNEPKFRSTYKKLFKIEMIEEELSLDKEIQNEKKID
jgi:hypothetical protein